MGLNYPVSEIKRAILREGKKTKKKYIKYKLEIFDWFKRVDNVNLRNLAL